MRQYRVININEIKPEDYASFGIALMVMKMHNWECRSIIDGKLRLTRFVEGSDDFYDFASDYKRDFEEDFDLEIIGAVRPSKKKN
tara:strand:+ start:231 stop:485 length:255 start_codon:yes stop_codon:yes gene_type:complete